LSTECVIGEKPIGVEEKKMVAIHPNILERDGKKAFVVLPYEEFVMMEEELQEYHDLKELRAAKAAESHEPAVSLDDVKKELGL
jgi:PHD/YefM family antitoxin component YafN of YafNO toxin-antitoxin module